MVSRAPSSGVLYVVATPIGNLGDLSARARSVLAEVDLIAAEDTRHTLGLLKHLGISKPMLALHEHNERQRSGELLERLQRGEKIALVSDAGTPLISDPGYDVVRTAIANDFQVISVPGACAAIAALSISGLPTDRFLFAGFLPAKTTARREKLQSLRNESATLIWYEAPHRLAETLADIATELGDDRRTIVARELTKQFETTYYGTAAQLAKQATVDVDMSRGEIVIVIAGAQAAAGAAKTLDTEATLRVLLDELPPAQAAKIAAKLTGAKRADLYDMAMRFAGRHPGLIDK